ncbi:MAG TPA: RNA 2',3'-cyclic phosphodiesterase [Candidatus Cybelea sp.]
MAEHRRRLFIGIELDAAARARCSAVSDALSATGFAARYEAADKLHATLAFLGNVERARYDSIAATHSEVAARCTPFALQFDKAGAFPNERRPRVVYVGAREQGAAFRSLATAVQSAYAEFGFSFKEDAVAHVTIARVKEPSRPLPLLEVVPFGLEVRTITLFESIFDAKANTSRYEIAQRAPLSFEVSS